MDDEASRRSSAVDVWPLGCAAGDETDRAEHEHAVSIVRTVLGEAGFAAAWGESRALSLADAAAFALAVVRIAADLQQRGNPLMGALLPLTGGIQGNRRAARP